MLLTHRSVSYDYTPPQVESGLPYGEDNYRGVNSSRCVSEATPLSSIASRMRALQAGRSQNIKRREQSMLARLNAEVGLGDFQQSLYPQGNNDVLMLRRQVGMVFLGNHLNP